MDLFTCNYYYFFVKDPVKLKKIVLILGASELGFVTKKTTALPCLKLLRYLRKLITVVEVDEYLTSQVCSYGAGFCEYGAQGVHCEPLDEDTFRKACVELDGKDTIAEAANIFISEKLLVPQLLEYWVKSRKKAAKDDSLDLDPVDCCAPSAGELEEAEKDDEDLDVYYDLVKVTQDDLPVVNTVNNVNNVNSGNSGDKVVNKKVDEASDYFFIYLSFFHLIT